MATLTEDLVWIYKEIHAMAQVESSNAMRARMMHILELLWFQLPEDYYYELSHLPLGSGMPAPSKESSNT